MERETVCTPVPVSRRSRLRGALRRHAIGLNCTTVVRL